jgi:hypothetical protein
MLRFVDVYGNGLVIHAHGAPPGRNVVDFEKAVKEC